MADLTHETDLARVYPNGQELALGNQAGGTPEANGHEKATQANAGRGHPHEK
jgi:hypothetical protein